MLRASLPLSVINLTVYPRVNSFAIWFTLGELAMEHVSIRKCFKPTAIPLVVQPSTFVSAACVVLANPKATPETFVIRLPSVDRIFGLKNLETTRVLDLSEVKFVTLHLV